MRIATAVSTLRMALVALVVSALSILPAAIGEPLTELSVPERPEGIAKGPGSILYVSQITSGKVLAIDAVTGETTEIVGQQTDRQAWGLWYLEEPQGQGYLFVAGGGPSLGTGQPEIYLYHVDTGDSILACSSPPTSHNETGHGVFLNDVAVLNGVAYVTNSFSSKLLALDVQAALAGNCSIQELFLPQEFVPLHPGDWGTNGIAPYQLDIDGAIIEGLFVSNEQDGTVFSLQFGTDDNTPRYQKMIGQAGALGADGLVFDDHLLYVTQNTRNRISVYNISADSIGALYSQRIGFITSPEYNAPATSALYNGYIYSTNSRLIEQPNLAQEPDHNNVIGVQNPFATRSDDDHDEEPIDETEEQDDEDTAETPETSEEGPEGEGEIPELSSSSSFCLGQELVAALALVMAMIVQSTFF